MNNQDVYFLAYNHTEQQAQKIREDLKVKTIVSTAIVLGLLMPAVTLAQDSTKSAGSGRIAVLDVARVFKEHKGFTAAMESLKSEVTAFDAAMKKKGEALRKEAENLQVSGLKKTSPKYSENEAKLAKRDAELRIEANQKKKEILDREAKLYLETYAQIQDMVGRIAKANDITLVLRFDSSKIDSTDRASVIKGVNRAIVFQRDLDLTDFVLQQLNPQTARAGGTNQK